MTESVCFVLSFFLLTLYCGHFLGCYLTFILNGCLCSLLWLRCDSHNHPSFERKKKSGFFIVCRARLFSCFHGIEKKENQGAPTFYSVTVFI